MSTAQLADSVGIHAEAVRAMEDHDRAGDVLVEEVLRVAKALGLDPARLFDVDPVSAPAPDDVALEAALAGGTIDLEGLALGLGWSLSRLEAALATLDRRLQRTGIRLWRPDAYSIALAPRPGVLDPIQSTVLAGMANRGEMSVSAAALLFSVTLGFAHRDADDGEQDHLEAVQLLREQGLVEGDDRQDLRPSHDVIESLGIDPARFGLRAQT